MIRVTSVPFNQKGKSVSFEKTRREIIDGVSDPKLRKIVKELVSKHDEWVLDVGIPLLLEYSEKGEFQRKQSADILKDVIESEEIQNSSGSEYMFNGIPYHETGRPDDDEGYIGAYEKLTGVRLNVSV